MAQCINCNRCYREPPGEEGDHDCPCCGLTPEERENFFKDDEEETEEDDDQTNDPLS